MNTTAIDRVLSQACETGLIPGVVAMVTTADDILYTGAFGSRAIDQAVPMSPDTLFWIASMTKAVTATAAMQLVEEDKLQLDTLVGSIVPALADVQVLTGFDNNDRPCLRPPKRAITLRHLLTHTAGFSYDMWNGLIAHYCEVTGTPGTRESRPESLALPLVFDPGERWEYGINIDWLGRVIEEVSGQRLGDYFAQKIFGPLGMDDTTFAPTPAQRSRLAPMHLRRRDNSLRTIDFAMPTDPIIHMGGGGLHSTGPDYLHFLQMFLSRGTLNGAHILSAETINFMAQNQIGDLSCQTMQSVKPKASNDVNFFPGMVQKWGLSFLINTAETPHGRAAGSLAWAGLGNTYFWIDQKSGIAGLFLTQIFPFFDPGAVETFRAFEKAIYAAFRA